MAARTVMYKFITRDADKARAYIIHFVFDQSYLNFYKWLNTVKPEYNHTDFPRDYIVLSKEDEETMLIKFKDNIQ
jgi:hypothetical protein